MPNPENLINKGFESRPDAINRNGRPKGSLNSKTRLKRFLELIVDIENPVTGEAEKSTVLEKMDLVQISRALNGDLNSYKEILDRLEGKVKNTEDLETPTININLIDKLFPTVDEILNND